MRKRFFWHALVGLATLISSCKKHDDTPSFDLVQAKTFSSDVAVKWLDMQLNMQRVPLATGATAPGAEQSHAYEGIALYEAIVPGMRGYQSLQGQLTNFPSMPVIESGKQYHWGVSANAALATINRSLFAGASAANKTSMDSLEAAFNASYATGVDTATINRSIAFGKEVGTRIAAWAATDGFANSNPPYMPAAGPGLWASTPPNFPAAANPYLSQCRLMVPGVADGTALAPPPAYSTDPSSPFYAMVKDVYDKSQALTPAQTAQALYFRDAPGYPAGGHFASILSQVLNTAKPSLDIAAIAYAKTGIAFHDAVILCFTQKYSTNLLRPITYIRNVMGYTSWLPVFNTPGHPEFPAAHAVNSAAVAKMLSDVFGSTYSFTLHTYDNLGFAPRSYNSFADMAKDIAGSRVYGGIHYQASCDKGLQMGDKISQNILSKLKFLK